MFDIIQLNKITPASYNPRKLSNNAFENLQNSIKKLGIIKPIIIRQENMTIVAGHQRTKTMKSLGITESPCFQLKNVNKADEVRFNQFHNQVEYEISDKAPKITISANLTDGFNIVSHKDIMVQENGDLGLINGVLTNLLLKYGDFGSAICEKNGNIFVSSAYAFACKRLRTDLLVYCMPDDKVLITKYYFGLEYGRFDYENIEKKTYMQTLAQMKRLRNGKKGTANSMKSTLYEKHIIPYLVLEKTNGLRIVDFGCGQKDYLKRLRMMGYDIVGVDPYFREGMAINYKQNQSDFLRICNDLKKYGKYDVVICDSVLNSVDSLEAEKAVMMTILGLCKKGGVMFFSGRPLKDVETRMNIKATTTSQQSLIKFLDKNNFTGLYRNGDWFFQKFHSDDEVKKICSWVTGKYEHNATSSSFQIKCINDNKGEATNEEIIAGLKFEWDMVLPNGKNYGLSNEIENAYKKAIENE